MNDELFGATKTFLAVAKILEQSGADVRDYQYRNLQTFEVDFAALLTPSRKRNKMVSSKYTRAKLLMLWVRIEPTLPQIQAAFHGKIPPHWRGRFPCKSGSP